MVTFLAVEVLSAIVPDKSLAVIVTTRNLERGHLVQPSDVSIEHIDSRVPHAGLARSVSEVVKRQIVQDIPAKSLLYLSCVDDMAPLPSGYTVISLPLASNTDSLLLGSTITLFAGTTSPNNSPQPSTPATTEQSGTGSLTVPAIVMNTGKTADSDSTASSADSSSPVLVGVEASHASLLLELAADAPLFAVERND